MNRSSILISIRSLLLERIESLLQDLDNLQSVNEANTGSTAGDKHDTERAMVHQEMESISKRLENEKRMLHTFDGLLAKPASETAAEGSIVVTDRQVFFLGLAFGLLQLEETKIMGISSASPMGQELLGLASGNTLSVNGIAYTIQWIG